MHASVDDRPRRHTAPFTGGPRTSRRNTWEALDPDTGGERGTHDASQPPQCLQPQLVPLPTATMNGSHRSGPCLIRSGSATTELCDLQRQRSDPQSLGRAGSLVRHVSDQVTPVPDLCHLPLRNLQQARALPCCCAILQHEQSQPQRAEKNTIVCILQGSGDLEAASSRRTSTFGDVDPENAYTGMTKTSSLPGLIGNALGLRLPHVGGPAYQAASGSKAGPHVFKWVRSV